MKIHLPGPVRIDGFAISNAKNGETVQVLTRAALTSDDASFYVYIDELSSMFLNRPGLLASAINQFLVVVHDKEDADLYVNDPPLNLEIRAKRDLKQGEPVMMGDIADITRLEFVGLSVQPTDKVAFCFKVGWKFGLFFDLSRAKNELDSAAMAAALRGLHRYLTFEHVYKSLEAGSVFEALQRDGWFPFIEIVGHEYKELQAIYTSQFDVEARVTKLLDRFHKERVLKIVSRWWNKSSFAGKRSILEAGIQALLQGDQAGYIACLKILLTEIEGILRSQYATDTGKAGSMSGAALLDYIVEKERRRSASDQSLLLPLQFLQYLKDVSFAKFDTKAAQVPLSRHSAGHGAAAPDQYTRARALQAILVLDQIWFYS